MDLKDYIIAKVSFDYVRLALSSRLDDLKAKNNPKHKENIEFLSGLIKAQEKAIKGFVELEEAYQYANTKRERIESESRLKISFFEDEYNKIKAVNEKLTEGL